MSDAVTTIGLVSRHPFEFLLRQSQDGRGRHGPIDVRLGAAHGVDWLAVVDEIAQAVRVDVPRERRILFVSEPPEIKRYRPGYVDQFGVLLSPYPIAGYGGQWVASQPALPWFFGLDLARPDSARHRFDLAALRALAPPADKQARLSVVCSTKTVTLRHRQRLVLIERLMAALPGRLDVFGQGFRPITDKADAILPYQYHLVLENNDLPRFWTEKLADALLGYALPLFSGCADVGEDFPAEALVRLADLADPDDVVAAVVATLDAAPYAARLPAIASARRRLIEEHNFFAVLARLTSAGLAGARREARPELIRPARDFKGLALVSRQVEKLARRLMPR